MREASLKHLVSSLGSRTSVLDIPRPIVSIYTHRHTIENFEILNFFGFDCHHLRGVGFWSQFFVPLGAHTCACWVLKHVLALFEAFPNKKKYSWNEALLQTSFLANSQNNEFLDHFTPCGGLKTAFWGLSTKLSG